MIKLFEMFAGYGGASFALKKAKIPFECVGYSEIDKYAIKCYEQNHGAEDNCARNYGDCSKMDTNEIPDFDLLTGGFPCQDVSIAGKRDLNKGRTNLYEEILRVVKDKMPRYILLENVKGLTSMKVDERALHLKIAADLNKLGYGVCWKILNSKDYGIPQNRERIWFVCKFGGWDFMEFMFPLEEPLNIFTKDLLEKDVDKKYNLKEKQIKFITDAIRLKKKYTQINGEIALTQTRRQYASWNGNYIQFDVSGKGYNSQQDRVYNANGIMCCIPNANPTNKINIFAMRGYPRKGKKEIDGKRFQNPEFRKDGCSNSLTTVQKDNLLFDGLLFRRLTPRECFRLMGFLDDEINLDGIGENHLYELAGNGWDINLVSKIFKNMIKSEVKHQEVTRD